LKNIQELIVGPASTVVEILTQNPKVKGSNPATGSRNEKMPKKDQKVRKK
jgi:hypothetical protein